MADARYAPKPSSCDGCPAQAIGRGYVPGKGPQAVRHVLLGQGPGEHEAIQGEPFVGPSGWTLDRWLAHAGIDRRTAWVDNVVRCWLPGNRSPTAAEVRHCTEAHVWPALRQLRPAGEHPIVLTTVGAPATEALLGKGIPHGTIHRWQLPAAKETPVE